MKTVMDSLFENLRKAFPHMSAETYARNQIPLSLAYLKKCQKYFDFAAMYPAPSVEANFDSDTESANAAEI